jgi:hypothetical protein
MEVIGAGSCEEGFQGERDAHFQRFALLPPSFISILLQRSRVSCQGFRTKERNEFVFHYLEISRAHHEIQQKMIAKEHGEMYMALAKASYGLPNSCAPRHKDSPYGRGVSGVSGTRVTGPLRLRG